MVEREISVGSEVPLDRAKISAVIPHRDPFLFVEEVVELVPDRRARGRVAFPAAEAALAVLPSLVLEAMAQVGAVAFLADKPAGRRPLLAEISRARLLQRVAPTATLDVTCDLTPLHGSFTSARTRLWSDGALAADANFVFTLEPVARRA